MKLKILGLFLILAAIVAFTVTGQNQKPPKQKTSRQRDLPIVDFSESGNDAKQKAKANRYDRQSSQKIQDTSLISRRVMTSHWSQDLSALPFPQSDVVLIGGVMDAKAHLSNDKTGIYSEFEVQVEEVFKNATTASVDIGRAVSVERRGGAVRFPSGVIQKFETVGQGMPSVGQRYLFFLKRIDDADYGIITAYQLDGEVVSPLDGAAVEEGTEQYPFDEYDGFDVPTFLKIVKTQAAQEISSSH